MSDLTPRQTEILRLIQRAINETGMPPTRAEIANELGFKSPNAAEEHLRALARKGVIALVPGASRGIKLMDTMREQLGFRSSDGWPPAVPFSPKRISNPASTSILPSSAPGRTTC